MMKKKGLTTLLALGSLALCLFLQKNKYPEKHPQEVIALKFEFTTIFLIPLDQGYVLIDNAYAREYGKFLEYLEEHHIELHDIRYILLTHHHDDHVGFLNQITSEHPQVRVVLHKETAGLLTTGYNNKNNGGGIVNKRIYALFRLKQLISPEWDLSFPPYYVRSHDIVFEDDFTGLREMTGINLRAITTPGHSSDSVTYIYNNRYAFCGDLASNFLNWAGAGYLTLFNEDLSLVYTSWRTLIDHGVEVIIPAHGDSYPVDRLVNNLDKKKQENSVPFF